jgi:hypothetical protein
MIAAPIHTVKIIKIEWFTSVTFRLRIKNLGLLRGPGLVTAGIIPFKKLAGISSFIPEMIAACGLNPDGTPALI